MAIVIAILLMFLQEFPSASHQTTTVLGSHTDKAALLAFKKTITADPNSMLANWEDAMDMCRFTGVVCIGGGASYRHRRVNQLNLTGANLVGLISPTITNLTSLYLLDLSYNHLFGIIPPMISLLRNIRYLHLDENNLVGPVPVMMSSSTPMPHLKVLTLGYNMLTGDIPASFFSNCSPVFQNLDLSANFLTGEIPRGIGNCPKLWYLNLYSNHFTGLLPASLANASNLCSIDVEYNFLRGELPSEIIAKLTSLNYLHLSFNDMISHDNNTNLNPFFTSLANCTHLEELQIGGMSLGGTLPTTSIAHLGVNLTYFMLQENMIFGSIPPSLGNFSFLMVINLTANLLSGSIPAAEISKLPRLQQLSLSHNLFSNTIPPEIGRFAHLGLLDLSYNGFSGEIPKSIGNLVHVNYLFLNNNNLSGAIPPSLGLCSSLYELDLSHNRLTGRVPSEILGIRDISIFLNLSHNRLEGPVPIELSKFENVQSIDLSSNNLSGSLFQMSSCLALRNLNLSHNSLHGTLPESIGYLKNLEVLDVSRNSLSGLIPLTLGKMSTLSFLNLSFNDFNGLVPSQGILNSTNLSISGNTHLCGSFSLGLPGCHRKRPSWLHLSVQLGIIFSIMLALVAFALLIKCCTSSYQLRIKEMILTPKADSDSKSRKLVRDSFHSFPRITYWELLQATGGFGQERLIGTGSYGHVYKGIFQDGTTVAVKVLHLQTDSTKSFNRECQVLKSIRHRNLIGVITACSLPDFKALVLPYMSNGNLDDLLYRPPEKSICCAGDLSVNEMVNICSDIAEGMAYLHHHSPVCIIHCDLKPSNVLLNDDMTALVSDFGISRLVMTVEEASVVSMGNSTANLLAGSIGYIAPEYGYGSSASTKGDVYSFGVLVLEMVTRRRPTGDMFASGVNLQNWVKTHYCNGELEKVVDSSLMTASKKQPFEAKGTWEVAATDLIELGILCTQDSPSLRPTMLEAADGLDRMKRYLGGDETAAYASSSFGKAFSNSEDDKQFL